MAKDHEEQNKKLKKKVKHRGRVILLLILLLLLIAAVFILFKPFGFGLGMLGMGTDGSAQGASPAASAAATTEAPKETASEPAKVTIYVTIKGETYIMNDSEVTVEDIVSAALEAEGDVTVRLSNDGSIAYTYDVLIEALKENNIHYELDETFDVE